MKKELPHLIGYSAEMTRDRFWQEAYLVALAAALQRFGHIADDAKTARRAARFASEVAEEAFKNHGPSVSDDLQTETPFVAAAGVVADEPDPFSDDRESDGY